MHTEVQLSLEDGNFIPFEYIPQSGIAGTYGSSSFVRNTHTIFHNRCINLQCHQQYAFILFSLHRNTI